MLWQEVKNGEILTILAVKWLKMCDDKGLE
jgi:hypothetical protein